MRIVGLLTAITFSLLAWGALLTGCQEALTHIRPPAQYVGKPASTTIIIDDQEAVTKMCIGLGLDANTVACANPNIMIVPDPCEYTGVYAEMMCHETGHVLGWDKSHPMEYLENQKQ